MDAMDQIIAAQDRILRALAICEKVIGELYELYRECQPTIAEFWGKLAAEEKKHAAILELVRSDLKQGTVMHGLGHFTVEQVQNRIDFVQERIAEARQNPPTEEQAVAIALSIESSIIDSRFFEFAKSDGCEFQKAAYTLTHETQDHIQMVQDALLALEKVRRNKEG